MGKAARSARRHGLGRPLHTYRQAFPAWWSVLWVGMVAIVLGALLANGVLDATTKLVAGAVTLVLLGTAWLVISDRRLVICEGGLLIGSFAPLAAPMPVPAGLLEPRGVTCVGDVGRFPRVTGRPFGSTLFLFPQSRRGVLLDGPPAARVRTRASLGAAMDTAPDTVRGGTLWAFAYRGDPGALVDRLHRLFTANGVPHADAVRSVALPERGLGADLREARTRVNGLAR